MQIGVTAVKPRQWLSAVSPSSQVDTWCMNTGSGEIFINGNSGGYSGSWKAAFPHKYRMNFTHRLGTTDMVSVTRSDDGRSATLIMDSGGERVTQAFANLPRDIRLVVQMKLKKIEISANLGIYFD